MPNDVITLKAVAHELNELLSGGRIEKIYQPETDEITLSVKTAKKTGTLVISANPAHPRIHITTQKKENSPTAPAFCMLVRKYFSGGIIEKIEIFNSDRIIKISVISRNDLCDKNRYFIIAELMGRYSNIILTTEKMKIIDAIRRIHFDQSTTRYILPNLDYVLQPKSRISLNETDKLKIFFENNNISPDSLIANISGISRETAKEIASSVHPFERLNDFINIRFSDSYCPCLRYEKGILKDYYVKPYKTVQGEYINYNSINEALDSFYSLYDKSERKKASTKTVTTVLKRLQTKTERRIADNKAKLAEANQAEFFQQCGNLILSNIYKIKPHDETLKCFNYYDNETIEIKLDNKISPADNAQLFFKKYSKLKRAGEIANNQLISLKEQKEYLDSIAVSIKNCSLKKEYDEILDELNALSGLKPQTKKSKIKEKPSSPTHFRIHGYDVYLGKNNLQNNEVTFTIGKGGDIWIHAKSYHGAHIVIKGTPPSDIIEKAASVAAYYSSGNSADKVEVDYTLRKYVKKIPSAMPGMVTYSNYNSVLVKPIDYIEIKDKE